MGYISIGIVFFIMPGLILFLGLGEEVNKIPINFGYYSPYYGALFILIGALFIIHGFRLETKKLENKARD
jgi:hypothetical protein